MSLLLSINKIQKTLGSKLLFENLSLGIFSHEKIGLIGPNGSGKSTLLKIMAGYDTPDAGEVSPRKNLEIALVAQDTHFQEDISAKDFIIKTLVQKQQDSLYAEIQATTFLSMTGFEDPEVSVSALSGGWKKRLAIARALAHEPELLILDEPTNHMDWDGLLWLESWLKSYKGSFILVSHDREFLNQVTNRTIEINPLYANGYLSYDCSYSKFLEEKDKYIQAQMTLQESLSNKARREVEWLRAGVKARTTKSQSRIQEAHQLLERLETVKDRNRSTQSKTRLEIDATERKTKKLIELKSVSVGYDVRLPLVQNVNLILGPKQCLGLLGDNGSGKTTLLKAIAQDQHILAGSLFRAEDIRIVYFDQKRERLPQDINLMQFLGNGSDYVIFKGQSVHVAAYASRFLFTSEKMQLKISQLSGGEQARLLIAQLLLSPADVLILDEPTNDLDIETIEVLEDTLSQFEGLILLVSHDRTFMSKLCQNFLGLRGAGEWATYASIDQWLKNKKTHKVSYNEKQQTQTAEQNISYGTQGEEHSQLKATALTTDVQKQKNSQTNVASKDIEAKVKVKMSYKEKQQLQTIEQDIALAEEELLKATRQLEDPQVFQDKDRLFEATTIVTEKQNKVDELYELWQVLEEKARLLKL